MKKRELNRRINARGQLYYDACDKINKKFKVQMIELDKFRMSCIETIFSLKNKDTLLKKYHRMKEEGK